MISHSVKIRGHQGAEQFAKDGFPLGPLLLDIVTAVGVVIYRVSRRRRWSSSEIETLRVGVGEDLRKNIGPGKLPRPGDVEASIELARVVVGANLYYTEQQFEAFIAINPGALRCLRTSRSDPTRLTGYYVLLALTERGEGLL